MLRYILRRLLLMFPLLLGITVITFGIMHLAPGRPTDMITEMNPRVSPESRQRLIAMYDLDKPWYVQYGKWLQRFARFDFGVSFKDDRPVMKKIAERLPATLLLNILSLIVIFAVAVPIGTYSAVRQNSWLDRLLTVFVFIGFSVPTFWLALLLMIGVGLKLGLLPITGLTSISFDDLTPAGKIWDVASHLILPVFVMSFTGLAAISRYVRNGMLEVIRQDYVRTARAKGLPENLVVWRHAFRNALIPVVTLFGLMLPELIGGAFIFETIFAYPGMGRLGYEAIMARDYPVVMGVGVIAAFLTLLGNFLSDITYAFVDPRIRYTK